MGSILIYTCPFSAPGNSFKPLILGNVGSLRTRHSLNFSVPRLIQYKPIKACYNMPKDTAVMVSGPRNFQKIVPVTNVTLYFHT